MSGIEYQRADWIQNSNIYEVNLRQYSEAGTFNAFAMELPRLKDMGVEILWFMPITPISKKNRKGTLGSYYACSDYVSVSPEFGTMDDLKNLLKQAKAMGFKIMMDWVANHTGWDHVWTTSNPDFFSRDVNTGDFKMAEGMEDIIELDYSNTDLRKAMIGAMEFWVRECDIDGFRCDLAFWVVLDFWLEARSSLEKIKTLFWLGEFDPLDKPDYCLVFDAGYTWTWMHKTETFYKEDQNLASLKDVLIQYDAVCGKQHIPLWFTSNHDENSWNGTEYEKYGDMAKAVAVFSFTWEGMPMIYSGQELPNRKRIQFFEKDNIEWKQEIELHQFYKTLLALHAGHPALRAADTSTANRLLKTNADTAVIAYERRQGARSVLVLLNFSAATISCNIDEEHIEAGYTDVFNKDIIQINSATAFQLLPWGWLVYEN